MKITKNTRRPSLVVERPQDAAVHAAARAAGYSQMQATVLAGRLPHDAAADILRHVAPRTCHLDSPWLLPDIDVAANALADAIQDPTARIAAVCDHDADGQSSLSVIWMALTECFNVAPERITRILSHRLREGYGVSGAVVDRILEVCQEPTLIVTADQGSTDEPRFKRLREAGHRVIVTDHHEIPDEGPPGSALACVNPVRADSQFPDKNIAGCHVAWLVMCATRQRLIERGHLPGTAPTLGGLLDIVAVGTCADAVSFARSVNNRVIVAYGLSLMNTKPRPAWRALRRLTGKEGAFDATDLSHGAAPRINARGRLGDAMVGADFLCAQTIESAVSLLDILDTENNRRKEIEKGMLVEAMAKATEQMERHAPALVIHLPDGHPGVHGIVASRLVDAFGRPSACLSPKQGMEGMLTASLRGVEGIHVRNALATVKERLGHCPVTYGGHAGAAGALVDEADVDAFRQAFCEAVLAQRQDLAEASPVLRIDGALMRAPDERVLAEIEALGPYGREYEAPLFKDPFWVRSVRPVGDGSHLKLELVSVAGSYHNAIWFRAIEPGQTPPVAAGKLAEFVYAVRVNEFRGRRAIDVHVCHVIED